ncbi:ATP-dependent Clp protease ATP-binding subunit [Nordella sp. HKS 07]|uniref:AAA family ATPase n=1 Tax=Nordella sp. HKS 07 TaxID=2712222 RepID=UPI0013E1A716|nr:AAA family ATPase [Nordella sp. HKS 07]QIG46510.1 ATP-dependent Clp protease ATP-binding subunit [Nordella sp. HKS 07]
MSFLTRGEDYLAKAPKFRLVGRASELKKLSSILVRNMANSVLLVGPGGVGCTALCMGLQASKHDPDAPFDIVNKRFFWLDTDALFSSGDPVVIRDSFQRVMGTLDRTPDSVLIIEDTRDFIEAARNIGTLHFINALCLAIKSKKTQVILEARDEDLDIILKSHSDLRELFTLVDLGEPEGDALFEIVCERAEHLNEFHRIRIAESAIRTAIELTSKYRSRDAGMSRAQPERSVSLLDRALATYRLGAHRKAHGLAEAEAARKLAKSAQQIAEAEAAMAQAQASWSESQERIKSLYKRQRDGEIAVLELEEELDKQMASEAEARKLPENQVSEITGRIAKFARLATGAGIESDEVRGLRDRIGKFQSEIATNRAAFDALTKQLNDHLELSRDIVLREFSQISGISVSKLNEDEREKLRNLEAELKKRIFGQDHVVRVLSNAVKTARVGRRNADKPQASFMFLGPSGVGKTEIAKALAASLLDDEKALTRFDMSEYMEKHAVSRLIGAPPGYEGFEAGGILTNAMRKNPLRILLFDEIEKAHPDVFNVFLQILSDGRLTDNVGRTVSFSDAIIVMTTNIGQPHFLDPKLTAKEANAEAIREIEKTYRSEFLNRFAGRQNIICFSKLDLPSIEKIVRREFDSIDRTYTQEGIKVTVPEADLKAFCKDHYDPAIGARGLPGFIQANIEPIIVNMILESDKRGALDLTYNPKHRAFEIKET